MTIQQYPKADVTTIGRLLELRNSQLRDAGLPPVNDHTSFVMDIQSVDAEFNMDWESLLNESGPSAAHDLSGIQCHLIRDDYPGKMGDCFVPRFAQGTRVH